MCLLEVTWDLSSQSFITSFCISSWFKMVSGSEISIILLIEMVVWLFDADNRFFLNFFWNDNTYLCMHDVKVVLCYVFVLPHDLFYGRHMRNAFRISTMLNDMRSIQLRMQFIHHLRKPRSEFICFPCSLSLSLLLLFLLLLPFFWALLYLNYKYLLNFTTLSVVSLACTDTDGYASR